MVEVAEETEYVWHHKKKIAFIFSAMRHFAGELKAGGWPVTYVKLDDPKNTGTFSTELTRAVKAGDYQKVVMTEPSEWRVQEAMRVWARGSNTSLEVLDDDRFICTAKEFQAWANDGRKTLRMEYFYRDMRRKTKLLMRGDKPEGDKWNYDSENRKPAKDDLFMPAPFAVKPDAITQDVFELMDAKFADQFGDLLPFDYAVTRKDALLALDHFVETALPNFGDYQDAMVKGEPFLYHSVLAQYLNCGLLGPLEICQKVEAAYVKGHAPLNAAEGFIRQIIGWREYVRGIYQMKMPDYVDENYFNHTRPLPDFYWTAETKMSCVKDAVKQTKKHAYAHHIQRLMVTGNFALLAGIDPKALHEWYLAVYSDAFEWVELPNTVGMSQFADGGILGSKPYVSSGNYINKMSDYCKGCHYNVKHKTEADACPFNALYWDFLNRHREKLGNNPRLGHTYRTWGRMKDETKQAYLDRATKTLEALEDGKL